MNRIYRLVWNRTLGVLQVVSETATGRGAGAAGSRGGVVAPVAGARPRLRVLAACIAAALAGPVAVPAWALPAGGTVVSGSIVVTSTPPPSATLQIFQASSAAHINWSGFDVAAGEGVFVNQPSASSGALFNVGGGAPSSMISGTLASNGMVVLANPSGTIFNAGASVNVGGFLGTSLAPTAMITNSQGISSMELALPTASALRAAVINSGTINAASQGTVALVGTNALNFGVVTADQGHISLVAADAVTADLESGNIVVTGALQGGLNPIAVSNTGTLSASGGSIVLEGRAAPAYSSATLVSNTGVLQAQGGSVRMTAIGGALVANGTIDVAATSSGGPGGNVSIQTDRQASVGANIKAGGGSVSIDAATIGLSGTVTADAVQLYARDSKGAISQSGGALNAGSLNIDAAGSVVLGSTANAISSLGTSTVGGNLSLTTSAGLAGSGALSVGGTSNFTTGGALSLVDAGNSFGGAVGISAGGNVALHSSGGLSVSDVVAGSKSSVGLASGDWLTVGNLSGATATLSAGAGMVLSGTFAASQQTSLSANGAISQTSGMLMTGSLDVNAVGDVLLSSAANSIGTLGASTVGGSLSLATSSALSQTGALNVAGASSFNTLGTLDLTHAGNSFGGVVNANASGGGVALRSSGNMSIGSLSANGAVSLVAGGTLTLPGAGIDNGANDLTLASSGGALNVGSTLKGGNVSLAARDGMTLSGAVTAQQQLRLSTNAGATTVVSGDLQAANTLIDSGTSVRVGNFDASGSIAGDITNNGTLAYSRTDNVVQAGAIGGSGDLLQAGGGRLTLTSANTYTGETRVAAGTLALAGAGSIASSSGLSLQSSAAVFDVSGAKASRVDVSSVRGVGSIQLGAKALAVGSDNASSTYAGTIAGTGGSLVKTGSGTLTLSGASTYDGGTELKQGRIDLGNANALGTGALAMDDGTALGFAANGLTVANDIRMTGTNDPVIDTGSFDAALSGAISGTGFLTKEGSGTLTVSGANNYSGATNVAAGTLRAGAANTFSASSAHSVASGATLDLAGFSQRIAGLSNSGTVSLAGSAPGTTLTVTGAYVGNNGVLRMGTALGDSASVSDRLVLSGAGASASGQTTIQVTNLGGLGAATTGSGIEIVSATGGATTTAQTTKNAFTLAGGHVDAGAFEYRLYAADASGAGENWYLRSATDPVTPVTPAVPGSPSEAPQAPVQAPTPTYRAEVPLLAALPSQLRQADLAMLGNLHQRIGDNDPRDVSAGAQRRAWARVLSSDIDIRQSGVAQAQSDGRLTGLQAGTDLLALANWRAGLYVGQLDGNVSVNGFASGVQNLAVGYNDLRNQYLGVYGTYTGASGFYADAVLQAARQRVETTPVSNARSDAKGRSLLASIELGQSFAVGGSWKVEPQVQLVHRSLDLDDMSIPGALVQQDSESDWLARAGVRIRGQVATSAGLLQPYARVNAYRASSGTDVARFIGPAGSTDIVTPTGHSSWELAAGATLALGAAVDLYGEVGQLHAWGGDEDVRSGVQGSVGLRVRW